jgi:hypothetical protein
MRQVRYLSELKNIGQFKCAELLSLVGFDRYGSALYNLAKRGRARARLESSVRRLTTKEARQLIESRKLQTVNGSWHYTWDIERFFDEMFIYESNSHSYIFHIEPENIHAPAPLFSDDVGLSFLIVKQGRNCPFWLLKLTSFDDFLARRSSLSSKPSAHFPTRQTYPKYVSKIACELERMPLRGNEDFFCQHYNLWKLPKYNQSGESLLTTALKNNVRVPKDWFFIHALRDNTSNVCKGVCLMIEDGRSASVCNLASERNHGTFMLVESVKESCKNSYSTFDCGVTGIYGSYKSVIYVDRMETDSSGYPSFVCLPAL